MVLLTPWQTDVEEVCFGRDEGLYNLQPAVTTITTLWVYVSFMPCYVQKLPVVLSTKVWFQNCRARHKKHVSPNHTSSTPMTSLQPSRLSQPTPTPEELQYTAYGGPEGSMLSALHSFIDSENQTFYELLSERFWSISPDLVKLCWSGVMSLF